MTPHARCKPFLHLVEVFYSYELLTSAFQVNMAKDKDATEAVPRVRVSEERPASLSEPLPREKLPKDLQKIVDREDDWWDSVYDGQYEFPGVPAAPRDLHV